MLHLILNILTLVVDLDGFVDAEKFAEVGKALDMFIKLKVVGG